LGGHLRSSKLISYILSENMEGRLEQPFASAYVLYLYKLYRSHIFGDLAGGKLLEGVSLLTLEERC